MALLLVVLLNIFIKQVCGASAPVADAGFNPYTTHQQQISEGQERPTYIDSGSATGHSSKDPHKKKKKKRKRGNYSEIVFQLPPQYTPVAAPAVYAQDASALPGNPLFFSHAYASWLQRGPPAC